MSNIEKIYTDYPLLDELVYAAKIMMTDCVLKDQELADNYETLESIQNADIYISIVENRAKYEYFDYTYDDFVKAGVPTNEIPSYLLDYSKVPTGYRNKLLSIVSTRFIDTYVEANNYYRTLNGLPNYSEGENNVYITEDDIKDITFSVDLDLSKPLHLQKHSEILLLESFGIIDKIYEKYPTYKYIRFIGKRQISIYDARKADKFSVLYVANPDNLSLKNRFCELLEVSRNYTMKTVYMEAYKFQSDKYDKFMIVFIILQAVLDMIAELPEYYIRRDIFDLRTIQYFFESSGVDYFPEIPLQYQISLVQNLNKLIKYSGTNKVIIEIASLFGFDNIEVFAYYMLKERKTDSQGNYVFETKKDPDGDGLIPDNSKNYNLKFIRVPLGESIDNYIKNENNHYDYSYLTSNDKYWNGEFSKEQIKEKILDYEFNIIRTKYLSVDAIVELTDLTFQIPYFVNMVMFTDIDKENLKLSIPAVSNDPIDITDAFVMLYSLMYEYYGVEDAIIDTPTKYLTIKGFNFDLNMSELSSYVVEKGFTLEELGVSNFIIPKTGVLTFNQLVSIYTNNKKIYNHLIDQMKNAPSKKIYDIYKYLYDAMMFTNASYDYYYIDELGRMATTYSEFLSYKDPSLFDYINTIKSESDSIVRETKISDAMSLITTNIQEYLDSTELLNIFSNIPTLSIDYLKNYMFKVINFFKSYKIELSAVSNIYKFSDKFENKIFVLDDTVISHFFEWDELVSVGDSIKMGVSTTKEDEFLLEEIVQIMNFINKETRDIDMVSIKENITKAVSLYRQNKISIAEAYMMISIMNFTENMSPRENIGLNISFNINDIVRPEDTSRMKRYYIN